ncbi:hypothetical protein SAMCCGM7_pC0661 (plasmid) [Sinorhizobium americanum CCGM7]|nr:hypothetical protein SAMCCGM7_pC0661 [Sinorhizobium americanum CCGM7]
MNPCHLVDEPPEHAGLDETPVCGAVQRVVASRSEHIVL